MPSPKRRRQKKGVTADPPTERPKEAPSAPAPPSVRRLRLWLFRLLALLIAPLLAVLLEAGLRVFHYGYPTGFYVETGRAGIEMTNARFGWRRSHANSDASS